MAHRYTHGGMYWNPITREETEPGVPDVRVCRRVADYAPSPVPAAAAIGFCADCGTPIAYNPHGQHLDRPAICMQCAGIQPLPIDS